MKFQDHPLEDLESSLLAQQNHHETDSGASLLGQIAKIATGIAGLAASSEASATNELNNALKDKKRRRAN